MHRNLKKNKQIWVNVIVALAHLKGLVLVFVLVISMKVKSFLLFVMNLLIAMLKNWMMFLFLSLIAIILFIQKAGVALTSV